jgi:branched-chain amino acid aminotransferase
VLPKSEKIWFSGKFVPWDEATIHVGSHVIHYGSSLFEGIRCYNTRQGPGVFRLDPHLKRLYNSCKIYRVEIPWSYDTLKEAILETIRVNSMDECYIRPIVFRGYHSLGVNPFPCPVECAIMVWKWGSYLGEEALAEGVDVGVSSWNRMAPNTLPAMAKAGANYMNSQLIKMEALKLGYAEGIALDSFGYVSEGSGENLFLFSNGTLCTPSQDSMILPGITRDCVLTLAKEANIPTKEQSIPREALYTADEVFMVGTAAEITPVRSIDRIPIGSGKRGPITKRLQDMFFGVLQGDRDDHGWFTYVNQGSTQGLSASKGRAEARQVQ